jgi:hypothetical protein
MAHIEYDQGFVIFDRGGDVKEVWRHSADCTERDLRSRRSKTDAAQRAAAARSMGAGFKQRGRFEPWALLSLPEATRMTRLIYPTLAFANGEHVYLFDLPTASMQQILDIGETSGFLLYIDHSPLYLFICLHNEIRVLDRLYGCGVIHTISITSFQTHIPTFGTGREKRKHVPQRVLKANCLQPEKHGKPLWYSHHVGIIDEADFVAGLFLPHISQFQPNHVHCSPYFIMWSPPFCSSLR